ncbi:MAG: 16S rRNA (cytosine(1402)-N(4))-methyltransferase RsmH [Candidatus Omnitrophota bacterium]
MAEKYLHKSVLLEECIDFLRLSPGKVIVDATIGGAGHAEEILKRILPGGRLIGLDKDLESLELAKNKLTSFKESVELIHTDFKNLKSVLEDLKTGGVDGILFDLGISSIQMETKERGFSIKNNGPLDMRMDRTQRLTAKDIINDFSESELSNLIKDFGEERFHNRIARAIVSARRAKEVETTFELVDIILKAIPYKNRSSRIHPATRTFQAIRIRVNDELSAIERALKDALLALKKGGRICVVSFHSLEDRIAKITFREFASKGVIRSLTKKPVIPQEDEISKNPRSRSAKLRIAERLA